MSKPFRILVDAMDSQRQLNILYNILLDAQSLNWVSRLRNPPSFIRSYPIHYMRTQTGDRLYYFNSRHHQHKILARTLGQGMSGRQCFD